MNIVKVSMIGANEHLAEKDIIDFLHAYPRAEIGIGVSHTKGACNTPRFEYVLSLMNKYNEKYVPGKTGTIALHINGTGKEGHEGKDSWPYRVSRGEIPAPLCYMMQFSGMMSIQLNHKNYEFVPDDAAIFATSNDLWNLVAPNARLILSYCEKTADYIKIFMNKIAQRNHNQSLKCDILYDASFGNGKMADKYAAPLYDGVRQGYAGGLGPDNILDELPKIQAVQTNPNAEIWIDAEGKLQNDAKTTLDLTRAAAFYNKIMDYQHS